MEIKVIRSVFAPKYTMGKMVIDGKDYGFTCEDTVRDLKPDGSGKIKNETAIPKGKYEVILSFSNHFQKFLPELKLVPFFAGIRIHGGNTSGDSEGCILLGAKTDNKGWIGECADKVAHLVELLKAATQTQKVWIEISDAPVNV